MMTDSKKSLSDAQIKQRRDAQLKSAAARKGKPLSPAEKQQRRDAAQLSTGPISEEGKAISSRNNWKTGEYSQITKASEWERMMLMTSAKPCKSTCTQYPCTLVDSGATKPGGNCLDKEIFVQAFDAIMVTLQSGDIQYSHGLLAGNVAQALDLLAQLRQNIAEAGALVLQPFITKDGTVIEHKGELVGKWVPNPVISHYTKLLDTLGISLPELMTTPRAMLAKADDGDGADDIDDLMSNIGARFGRGSSQKVGARHPLTIEAEVVE